MYSMPVWRGPAGGLDPEDRVRVDAAIESAAALDETVTQVEAARGQAVAAAAATDADAQATAADRQQAAQAAGAAAAAREAAEQVQSEVMDMRDEVLSLGAIPTDALVLSPSSVPVPTGWHIVTTVTFGSDTFSLIGRGDPTGLLSGMTWPSAPQAQPPNLIPQPAGEFGSATGWSTHTGLTIDTAAGLARWDGTSTAVSSMTIGLTTAGVLGRIYGLVMSLASWTAGSVTPGMGVVNAAGNAVAAAGTYARQMTLSGSPTTARMQVAAGSNLAIDYLRVYDLTSLLAKKWRIVFVYSQSNWVGAEASLDRALDAPEPRAIAIPCGTSNKLGAYLDAEGIGRPMPLVDPLQHRTNNENGGGPAGAFARTFCDGLRDDEVLVYVASGYSGGGRLAPDAVWNRQTNGSAWVALLSTVDTLLARAPTGSTVAGMLFCQGENDVTLITGDEHAAAIKGDVEFLRGRWGNFPVVINEIGYANLSIGNRQIMVDSHRKLDSASGDALALPRCRYIPRPAGAVFLSDGTHYDQATQRTRGALAGTALLGLNYGRAAP